MKLYLEISEVEILNSIKSGLETQRRDRLDVWVIRDLAHKADTFSRSQRVNWAMRVPLAQLVEGHLERIIELMTMHYPEAADIEGLGDIRASDSDIMPSNLCNYVDLPQGSTYREGRMVLRSRQKRSRPSKRRGESDLKH